MMMLEAGDVLVIAGTALGVTAVTTGAAYLALRATRRRSPALQIVVVAAAAVLSVVAATLAIAAEMYLSEHDLAVLVWIIGAAAVLTLAGSTVLAVAQRRAAARAETERLDAARRQLVAWVSHDLRTPLAGIRAMAEALEERTVADPAAYVRQIRLQADNVNRMVDALFELSKIQSGMLRLRKEPLVLRDLVSDVVADMRPIAGERGIVITDSGLSDLMLVADPHELTRVISNLLANSIRHAPERSEIVVSAHREEGDRVVVSVLDQGPGVEVEDLGRMFEIGWRASAARTADESSPTGAGLGLAIVRGIVEAHGGRVAATRADGGFRLDVILPAPR